MRSAFGFTFLESTMYVRLRQYRSPAVLVLVLLLLVLLQPSPGVLSWGFLPGPLTLRQVGLAGSASP